MGLMSFIFRTCLNPDKIFYLLMAYILFWSFSFVLRWEENYENLNTKYFETQTLVSTDCRLQFRTGHFKQNCREAEIFLSKPRWWRSLVLTFALSTLCGKESCITFLFGPDLYFTPYGGIVWAVTFVIVVWLVLTFSKMVTTKRPFTKKGSGPQPVYLLHSSGPEPSQVWREPAYNLNNSNNKSSKNNHGAYNSFFEDTQPNSQQIQIMEG